MFLEELSGRRNHISGQVVSVENTELGVPSHVPLVSLEGAGGRNQRGDDEDLRTVGGEELPAGRRTEPTLLHGGRILCASQLKQQRFSGNETQHLRRA
ncbi:hypothetical protein L345_17297 [Ophiophagus hannah]|uniref:Uncharacterized protein n=1 Tax=Ophiophagus hannah TaxID=8665 RepID=V8N551_OPHHA|nr:hypothetical protein L345_17297 [Ophiophagus hannah]